MKKKYLLPVIGFAVAVSLSCTVIGVNGNIEKKESVIQNDLLDENGYYVEQQAGVDAYYSQDYEKALDILLTGAELGDPVCITYVGCCCYYGYGVDTDIDMALTYLNQGASQGNALAMAMLGDYYRYDLNDHENAVAYYLDSANNGNAYAMNQYGLYCLNGYFGEEGEGIAAGWFEESANNGNSDALCNLGYCYLNGFGVDVDYNTAVKLFEEAANQENALGYYNLACCYEYGYGLESSLIRALDYYNVAADYGYQPAIERVEQINEILEEQDPLLHGDELMDQGETEMTELSAIQAADTPDTWGDPESWTWGKTYMNNNGMPVIYTKENIPGIYQTKDGSTKYVWLGIYHTQVPNNYMFFKLYDENDKISLSDLGISNLTMTVTRPNGNSVDMGMHVNNYGNIDYDAGVKGLGMIPGLLNEIQENDYEICFTTKDGDTFDFVMPAASDYRKVWHYVSDVWGIPTDNNDIYTGKDVCPDLVKFIAKYDQALCNEINANLKVGNNVTYANVKQYFLSSNELAPLQEQYELVCNYVYRKVDADYLDQYRKKMTETYFVNPLADTVVNKIGEQSDFWGAVAGFVNDAVKDNGGWGSLF